MFRVLVNVAYTIYDVYKWVTISVIIPSKDSIVSVACDVYYTIKDFKVNFDDFILNQCHWIIDNYVIPLMNWYTYTSSKLYENIIIKLLEMIKKYI